MKIRFVQILIVALTLIELCSCSHTNEESKVAAQSSSEQKPNIIWIIAEDLSPDIACYGNELVATPNIDGLAASGVRFANAFTTAPVCSPSRTALALGMYQTSVNAHHMRYPDELKNELPDGILPLNEIFRRNGYITANITDGPGRGKDDWSFKSAYENYDAQHWEELKQEKPFFAVVNLRLTHRPFERDSIRPIDPAKVKLPPYYPDHSVSRIDFAEYLESVQILDGLVGEVLHTIGENGWLDNSIICFLGDHGRPMSRGKNNLHDSGMQIPLIIASPEKSKWRPSINKGEINNQLVSAIDLSASSLAFAGITKPNWMQGKVLFGDQKEPARSEVYCALDRIGESHFKSRAIRTDKWKYIRNYNKDISINEMATAYRKAMHPIYHLLKIYDERNLLTPEQQALVEPMPSEELYDLNADPYEIKNLAANTDYQEVLNDLSNSLNTWQKSSNDQGMNEDSEELKEAFVIYGIQSNEKYEKKIAAMYQQVKAKI